MLVAHGVIGLLGTVLPAGRDDGELEAEGDERFQDERHAAHRREGRLALLPAALAQDALALAVVAETACLKHAFAAERLQPRRQVFLTIHRHETGCGYLLPVEKDLFGEPVLRGLQR